MKKILIITIYLFSFALSFSFSLDRENILKEAKFVNKKNYPNANFVILDGYNLNEYDERGQGIELHEEYVKILDEDGKKQNQVYTFYYNKRYSSKSVKKVQLIKSDRSIIEIDLVANVKDETAPASSSQNIYDTNGRVLNLNIPGLEIGDILYLKIKEKINKSIIEGEFSNIKQGEYSYPIKHYSYLLKVPKERKIKQKVLSPVKGAFKLSETIEENNYIYKFELINVQEIIREPSMPSLSRVGMRWLYTSMENWEEISKWYYNLCKDRIIINEEIKNKTFELIKDAKTDLEKISNIFYFVSRKVRYMGLTLEDNRPGFEPHSTDYTLKTMTGVCRDKAALIVAMLRVAGYDADMVLMNASKKIDKDLAILFFNHAICGVNLNGEEILLDPTDETSKDFLPQYEMDKPYLMATKEGDTLKLTKTLDAKENTTFIDTKIKILGDSYFCESEIILTGINDNAYRGHFVNLSTYEKERFMQKIIKYMSQNAELISFEISPKDLLDLNSVLKIKIKYNINDFIIGKDEYRMLKLPKLAQSFGLHRYSLGETSLNKRKYPLKVDYTAGVIEKITLEKEDGFIVELLPENIIINEERYKYLLTYSKKEKTLSYTKEYMLNSLEYSPKDYANLKDFLKKEEFYDKRYIIIR